MSLFTDPTPTWLKAPSVLDAPWQKAIRSLAELPILGAFVPTSLEDQVLAVGMPKTPLGRDVPDWVYKKLMSIKNPTVRNEVDRLGMAYDKVTDPKHKKELGKRLAELHRIGTGGGPFKPSTDKLRTPLSKELEDPFLDNPIKDSTTIWKERLKSRQALKGLTNAGKKGRK